ncbi:MAG: permease [Candidatus Bipolaricaulaceae bacterium]
MKSLTKTAAIYVALGGAIWGLLALLVPARGAIVGEVVKSTFSQTIEIIAAVFIFIGLLQAWVPPATIAKLLGQGSGWKGLALASTVPIAIGGSLFTILPLVQTLIEKGARLAVAGAFITAWAGKLPLLPLEIQFLGWRFALVRLGLLIPSAIMIGLALEKIVERRKAP